MEVVEFGGRRRGSDSMSSRMMFGETFYMIFSLGL